MPTYGYYGKLPFAGDFLRNGLPPDFIEAWDVWLQQAMLRAEAAMGPAQWTNAYLNAPIWRFAIAPGLCGASGMAGIMMPSLDRVERRFPFCIATRTALGPVAANLSLQPVAERLEETALAMIDEGASTGMLAARLAAIPAPATVQGDLSGPAGSIWVAAGTERPRVLLCQGLPEDATDLFDTHALIGEAT